MAYKVQNLSVDLIQDRAFITTHRNGADGTFNSVQLSLTLETPGVQSESALKERATEVARLALQEC